MRLCELAWACDRYAQTTDYDGSFREFLQVTGGGPPDMENPAHRKAMLEWLNDWGCRQFKLEDHKVASEGILQWSREWASPLLGLPDAVDELRDEHTQCAVQAYANLYRVRASTRVRAGGSYPVTIGPTGAAKVLFALHPRALPPWDQSIRSKLGWNGNPRSYGSYLEWVRTTVLGLIEEARSLGITNADEIPLLVGRPLPSLPKLVDEYNWGTITKRRQLPSPDRLQRHLEERLREYRGRPA